MRALVILPALLALAVGPALAQKPRSFTRPEPVAVSETREATRAPSSQDDAISDEIREELDLERTLPYLAYTLGELHYLAFACSGPDDQQWREQMVELLAMEAADDRRWRDRLIEGFNDGYRAQQRYRTRCGLEADAERRALAHRGRDLSDMMRAAYFD
ncbi:TIGR02301 family protein [Maricaulis sp.]|uniref:TIGR02301 family protein n=1 Tax=Maricaulis sp. TaxID=1486257 RepID=UPI002B268961|nr:TIGR02301 family protein [Maricaulis sp.]